MVLTPVRDTREENEWIEGGRNGKRRAEEFPRGEDGAVVVAISSFHLSGSLSQSASKTTQELTPQAYDHSYAYVCGI
jgi:hypothetical protein